MQKIARKNNNNRDLLIRNSSQAFTLTELIITVVIISMIAAFAIPNYQKAVRKTYERNAILYLTTIHGANEIYKARSGEYVSATPLDLAGINNALSINIIDTDMTYSYTFTAATSTYIAKAAWTGGNNFTVGITQAPVTGANPYCFAGACPSL